MAGNTVITITHVTADGEDTVFVDAVCQDGGDVTVTEALGMIEYAKTILIEQAS